MTRRSHDDGRPYLTIVAWPEGDGRADVARLLAASGAVDEASARLRLGEAPPMIFGPVESGSAANAADALLARGGDAFTVTLAQVAALGATLKIKDLRIVEGGLDIDLWRGLSTTIRSADVQVLVRAQVKTSVRSVPPVSHERIIVDPLVQRPISGVSFDGIKAGLESAMARGKDVKISEKLDIHTRDGSVYQIDGDRFGYTALGALRGYGDKANMDSMCELLSHLAPDEIVDTYFSIWHPPAGHQRLRLPEMNANNDDPTFAFYSRWAAMVYRHVMGVG